MSKMKFKLVQARIDEINLSGNNPRIVDVKSDGFKELVESIAGQGVVEPVHVRTDPKQKKEFELLAGERRYRAAKEVGLLLLPALDHGDIPDDEAFEITFAENYPREDLTTLEHGRAVSILLSKYKNDYAAVASKLGKSETWVRQHAYIETGLITDFKTAVSAGGFLEYFTAAHLALVARFPAETQKIIYSILIRSNDGKLPVSALKSKVAEMLRIISKAKFDTAGCQKCTKRSGCQPMLWIDPDDKKSGKDDKCLDPVCWEKKEIAAEKKKFKAKVEKHPGLIAVANTYYLDSTEGKRLRKIYGKVLTEHGFKICNKDTKGAVPAVIVKGKGGKGIVYVKINETHTAAAPGKEKAKSLKTLRAELERKRWSEMAGRIAAKIGGMKFEDIGAPSSADGVFKLLLLITVYGCDSCITGQKETNAHIAARMEQPDKKAAIKQLAEGLWKERAQHIEWEIDSSGDEESKTEARLLAELFGIDIKAEYKQVCSEPAFAEPAEWAKLKADGTERKVKSKKGKVKKQRKFNHELTRMNTGIER